MATAEVRVLGLRELTRAFSAVSDDMGRELTSELKEAAEPVRKEGEDLALSKITNMPASPRWAVMRIGVSKAQGLVYMVPQARSRGGGKRPNLATKLMEQAMEPALEHNRAEIEGRVEELIDHIADRHGF